MSKKQQKRRGRPKAGEVPWEEIEAAYVQGEVDAEGKRSLPSLREVAGRYDVSHEAVARRASAGSWTEKRAAFTAALAKKVQQKVITKLAIDLSARAERRARLGEIITQSVESVLTGKLFDGVEQIEPIELLRLQNVLKAQAETDKADLTLDPNRGEPETGVDEADPALEAALDAVMAEAFSRNQSPGQAGHGAAEES